MTNPPTETDTGSGPPSPKRAPWLSSVHGPVFWPAALLILGFVVWGAFGADQNEEGELTGSLGSAIGTVRDGIVSNLGWYYILVVTGFVVVALIFGMSRMGNIKLGKEDDKPEFSTKAWFAMLFSAGMGIGLVFFGVAEPMYHLAGPKPGVEGTPQELGDAAMTQTILHWGVHAWAIYVVIALAIAYSVYRKGRSISLRWVLEPIFGDRVKGWLGDLIDVLAILGTVFGVATSLGLGARQIAAGLDELNIVSDAGDTLLVTIIVVITLIAITSVVTGLNKGIKWLSNVNVSVAGLLALFVLIAGPTIFILREFVQSIGGYLQTILALSFDVTSFQSEAGEAWMGGWTIFYWGWWVSWAPFVGMFIARISKGRTIREFVIGVLGVPVLVSIAWFAIMGGTGLYDNIIGDGEIDAGGASDRMLFEMLNTLPASTLVTGVAVILIVTFFVTSSDSGSLVVDMLASGGDPNPPTWSRVFWASMEGAVAIVLLLAGGLVALQAGSIALGVPFSIVILLSVFASWKAFSNDPMAVSKPPKEKEPVSTG